MKRLGSEEQTVKSIFSVNLLIFGCAGFSLCAQAFSSSGGGSSSSLWCMRLHSSSFSCRGAWALGAQAQWLWRRGPAALWHRESSQARGQTRVLWITRWTPNRWTTREGPSFKRVEFRVNLQAPNGDSSSERSWSFQVRGEIRGSDVDLGIICIQEFFQTHAPVAATSGLIGSMKKRGLQTEPCWGWEYQHWREWEECSGRFCAGGVRSWGKEGATKTKTKRVLEDQHSVPMLQEVQWDEDQNAPVTFGNVKSLLTALSVHNVADDLGLETKGRSETNKVYRDSHFRNACLRNTEWDKLVETG